MMTEDEVITLVAKSVTDISIEVEKLDYQDQELFFKCLGAWANHAIKFTGLTDKQMEERRFEQRQ